MLPHPEIWGKQNGLDERYPLALHLRDSAAAALVLWDLWLREGLRDLLSEALGPCARVVTAYVVGSHDVGKANSVFAGQHANYPPKVAAPEWIDEVRKELTGAGLPREVRRPTATRILRRHEQASAFFIDKEVSVLNEPASKHWHSLAVLGHHGVFDFSLSDLKGTPDMRVGAWGAARDSFLDDLREGLGLVEGELPEKVDPVATTLLAGLTVLADRIASRQASVKGSQTRVCDGLLKTDDPMSWINLQYEYFADIVREQLGVYSPLSEPTEKVLQGREPRPLQDVALEVDEGIWFAMAATGSGKTEAALLRHSVADERLLFLLPTQATTNAMMNRIRAVYKYAPNIASLAHGLSSTNDFYRVPVDSAPDGEPTNGLFPSKFLEHGSARLLAPVSVATVDQAIMGSLPLKWTPLRLLALANAHVVIDEAHTLDPYQTRLAESLLWWLGRTNARVTVLSATLPTWQRDVFTSSYCGAHVDDGTLVVFPSSEVATKAGRSIRKLSMQSYDVKFDPAEATKSGPEHLSWVRKKRDQYPKARIGVLANQVLRAQEIARGLADSGENVLALHSRMTAAHRRLVESQLEKMLGPSGTTEPVTVVGTQAMEASLDIDFDLFSTDLAPSPSLVQRAGRVWRRHDSARAERVPGIELPIVRVLRNSEYKGSLPYLPSEVDRAWKFIKNHRLMRFPRDLQPFVEAGVFDLENSLDSMDQDDLDWLVEIARKQRKAEQTRSDLAKVLAPDTSIDTFCSLTWFAARKDKDIDDDFPTTRFIEDESRKVVLLGDADEIPGAWGGSLDDLRRVDGSDKGLAVRALDAILPLSGKLLGAAKEYGHELTLDRGPLKGALALEVGNYFRYSKLAGLELR